jgi:hypothetical protein
MAEGPLAGREVLERRKIWTNTATAVGLSELLTVSSMPSQSAMLRVAKGKELRMNSLKLSLQFRFRSVVATSSSTGVPRSFFVRYSLQAYHHVHASTPSASSAFHALSWILAVPPVVQVCQTYSSSCYVHYVPLVVAAGLVYAG